MTRTSVNLKVIRERKFISRADLAAKSGVAESTIVRIEQGTVTPTLTTIRKLAEALGVDPIEIVPHPEDLTAISSERRQRAAASRRRSAEVALAEPTDEPEADGQG